MMKKNDYQADLSELLEGLDDFMSDLECVRDDVQDYLDEHEEPDASAAIKRMDATLQKLMEAAAILEGENG